MGKLHVRQIEAFRAVVTLRSMTRAAELLGISQPAVSRLIADFQESVGFRLFRRSRNSAEPTPDALLLFAHVDKLFTGLEELGQQINAIGNLQIGVLTVAATNSHATGFLPRLLADYSKTHPGIAISYHIHSHEQVIDWVHSGRADVGFVIQPVARSDLSSIILCSRPGHCVMPATHPLASKPSLVPADLAGLPYVSFPRGTALRFQIDGFFDRTKVERILTVEAVSHHTVCAFVANGLGIALVNPFAPIDGVGGALVARTLTPSVVMDEQMVFNPDSLSSAAASFKDYVLRMGPDTLAACAAVAGADLRP